MSTKLQGNASWFGFGAFRVTIFMEVVTVKKKLLTRLAPVISIVLLALFLISACDSAPPRIPVTHTFSPGPAFSTNFNDEDPRRQVRCVVIFEVIDEAAIAEVEANVFVVRNAVLSVLGELTMPEITTERNFDDISQRLVERVNEDLGSNIDLVVRAYFTEFALT